MRALATRALRVAIMTDAIGWHTRALQRALRERGAEGRCVDLARCSSEVIELGRDDLEVVAHASV